MKVPAEFKKGELAISTANFRPDLLTAPMGKLKPGLGKGLAPVSLWWRRDFIRASASWSSLGSCENWPRGGPDSAPSTEHVPYQAC